MAIADMKMSIKLAWWLKFYFYGLAIAVALTGREPDWQKVSRWIDRAMTLKFESTSESAGDA